MYQEFNLNTVLLILLIIIMLYVAYVITQSLKEYIQFETDKLDAIDKDIEKQEEDDYYKTLEEVYFNAQKDMYYGKSRIQFNDKLGKFKWIKPVFDDDSHLPKFKITKNNSKPN